MFNKIKQKINSKKVAISTAVLTVASTVPAFATTPTELTFNFDPAEMFNWTNTMLSALMPVLYITLGISLAFIIINALKFAFR